MGRVLRGGSSLVALLGMVASCHLAGGLDDLEYGVGQGGGTTIVPGGGTAEPGISCEQSQLEDDFSSGTVDPTLWSESTHGSPAYGIENGRYYVQPYANVDAGQRAELYSVDVYDLRECAIWVEMPSTLDPTIQGETYFELFGGDHTDDVEFEVDSGDINFQVEVIGQRVADAQMPYNAGEHRWLRYREEAGTLYMDTSPDAQQWTERLSTPSPWYISRVEIILGARITAASPSPGRAEFDNVNVVP